MSFFFSFFLISRFKHFPQQIEFRHSSIYFLDSSVIYSLVYSRNLIIQNIECSISLKNH